MRTNSYTIVGGDYENAGAASSRLKSELKRIGVAPEVIRRTIIAAYEAETNVVIHAARGGMQVTMDGRHINIEVEDVGPGIPDIKMAMREGYSTAPPAARELGFGAGMGLPNILKSSDHFEIDSEVGRGTRVRFSVHARAQDVQAPAPNSIRVRPDACIGCLQCLRRCPTHALRVWNDRPQLLPHLCVDCTACIGACVTGALGMNAEERLPEPLPETLLIPSSFLVQFGAGVAPERVRKALAELGFREIIELGPWQEALRRAVAEYGTQNDLRPVISPACIAAVNLIRMRFPSLLGSLAPFLSPIEAAQQEIADRPAVIVASCPCELTALLSEPAPDGHGVIAPAVLRKAVLSRIGVEKRGPAAPTPRSAPERDRGLFQVSGIRHVIRVLEEAENGILGDVRAVEFYACDQGCLGSPLLEEDPFVTRKRLPRIEGSSEARAVRRARPLSARAGMRLHEDMSRAISILSLIDEVRRMLPGKDCSLCGSPTCDTMAEDIVLGRASDSACFHIQANRGEKRDP
jgi:anti-sigma regulatory factor (Ser/Thr protein kinase)/NAD-dependent dihydropyrimidine dehydrogenase PreA subunit